MENGSDVEAAAWLALESILLERKAGFLTGMVLLIALRVFSSFLSSLSLPLPIPSTLIPLCCSNLLFRIYPGCGPIWWRLHKHFSNWGSGKGCSKLLQKSLVLMRTGEGPLCNTKLTIISINLNSSIVQWVVFHFSSLFDFPFTTFINTSVSFP